ncbi:MAG: HAD family hydrolase [Bryobacteraceae bacterium]
MGIRAVKQSQYALLLDRDGVINRAMVRDGKPYPPISVGELELLPGVEAALHRSKGLGLANIVITNQPDVARGTQSREKVDQMHEWLSQRLPIDDILVCYHDDRDGCTCRKPLPGLIVQAVSKHGLDVAGSFVVGDRWRDIDAGAAAGCRTILIDYRYRERAPDHSPEARVLSLHQAVDWIETRWKS